MKPFTRIPPPGWEQFWLAVPYVEVGRVRETGLDCWGLMMGMWWDEFGWSAPDPFPAWKSEDFETPVEGFAAAARLTRAMQSDFERVTAPVLGVCMELRLGGQPAHVGMCLGGGRFIHTQPGVGVSVERFDGFNWRNRIGGLYAPI